MSTEYAPAPQKRSFGEMVINYFRDFKVLRETRMEYWGMQAINILDCIVFFAVITIVPVFMSQVFDWSDQAAGLVITVFGSGTTICLFVSGMVSDWLGIRRSLFVAMISLLVLRGVTVWAGVQEDLPYRDWIAASAICLMAPFLAMVQTVFQAANKRFTTQKSRSAGFNLWYLFMNVGAAGAGFLIDFIRKILELGIVHVFSFGVLAATACTIIVFFAIRREEQLYGPDETPEAEPQEQKQKRRNPFSIAWGVVTEPTFWRFLVLVALLLGVRSVFLYMHLLMPKYWLRVIGPDAAYGLMQTINPVLVIIGLILLIPVLHRFSVFGMLVWGSMISAISLFVMAIPTWGPQTYVYSTIALVILTIGEVIWSPRLTEYTAAIAPKGQEGTYLGLSMVPYFFAKTAVSALSGFMLAYWVPDTEALGGTLLRDLLAAGEVSFWKSPSAMWLILASVALAGPLIALLMRGWFTKGAKWEKGEEKAEEAHEATDVEPRDEPTTP